jgi:septal ring factor EnvC (AmiA/AmiB activator)
LELNKLNASFEFYKNVYNKILEKNYTNSRTKCKQKERLANKKKNKKYYYKWKNVGTMCPSKQRKVHEIKKEREYLLDIDKKKEELNAFFEHYIHEHLEEKKKSLQGIEDTLSDLNKRQEKLIKSEEEVKSLKERVVGINGTIQKLKNSIAKDDSKLDTIQREIKKYELKKERFNLYILTIKELLRDKEIDSLWNYKNELDIKKFKQQPSNVRSNILEILDVWPTDTDSLSADDFSVTRCKTLKECKEYYSEELNNIEQDLKGLTSTKDSLEHSIENTKSRIEDFKKEQKDLNAAINKLESVPRFKYYNRLNNTKYFLYNKDEIKKEISNYKERKEKVKRNIEYLEALSQKLEQQKAAIEKESIQQKFIVDSIQIEFYEGFIENIWVRGHLKADKSRTLKFENRAPIGFSSKKAYDKNSTIWLTASDDDDAYWVLYMGELLTYLQHHENGTKDFSPANGTEEIKEFDKAIELRKQATFKILEAHVYSDFVGFNANSPNGLIQTEISKRFNLFTKRFGSFLRKDAVYCKCAGPRYGFNWGFGNFVRPSFVFSKFEDKERLLSVNAYHEIINGQLRSIKYVSTQDILQHEVFSVGALINVVTLDAPIQKSSLTLNAGFRFGRTELRDSVYQYKDNKISRVKEDNYGLNTVRGFLELDYRVTPQNRYGIGTSLRLVYMPIFTDNAADLYQYNRLDEYNDVKPNGNRWMVRFEASGFFKPAKDSDNKLFLRYRFHGQLNDLNYNFHQLQVGYSFYLLRNNVNVNKGTK